MIVKKFEAHNFRNLKDCSISFDKGINVLLGENAQGKTNTAEGIYFFARGRSFRSCDDEDMVLFGEKGFRILVEYEDKISENTLEYVYYEKERRRKKNGYRVNKATEFIGNLRAVIFTPDDLSMIKRGPEERRSFLNVAISQYNPEYVKIYAGYKKALENRNKILKNLKNGFYFDNDEYMSWTYSLSEYASFVHKERFEYIEKLTPFIKEKMKEISDGEEKIELIYKSEVEYSSDIKKLKENYLEFFEKIKENEFNAGISLAGPHRDDIEIEINGKNSRSFASQGQQRSVVLSIKLAEGEVIKDNIGEYPVYIFDDVLSELDEKRQRYVLEKNEEKQIIITCCNESEILSRVKNKKIVKRGEYF